ncbi:uncharacterized protein APUU_61315S [Aspergillus puulaauensis]|uniref:Uncharacterized protein n=1 Tax=Aspergillus puulaauensis TaxID=1220207 RepID=A0A7R7XV19_9EURO|nr:uncharacterized protein APUU_61315S [Aspergillus puulaauensis]BCS28267.1 hypothetical protein APUU_61315S [Aspergillus puulaauensis]
MVSPGFAFVPVDSSGKTQAIDRKTIRSHCMRGKNRRIGVPRRSTTRPTRTYHSLRPVLLDNPSSTITIPCAYQEAEDEDDVFVKTRSESIASFCAPSNIAQVKLAIDMDDTTKELVIDSFLHFNQAMYPAELFKGFNVDQSEWGHWLFHDPAYLQCAFFMAFTTRDITENRPITPATYSHLREAIIHLNKRLSSSDNDIALGNSTIATVIILTMFSCIINDHEAAKTHIAGLQQMVRLRGGLQSLALNPKLYLKLGRVDLIYSLNTGSQGLLCTYPLYCNPVFYRNNSLPTLDTDLSVYGLSDPQLIPIFLEMRHYSSLINAAHTTRQRRSTDEYHTAVCSFQYRLLQLNCCLEDTLSECLRLTLLAFLITTFQTPGIRAKYPYLADCLRGSCLAVPVPQGHGFRELMRWILIVGAVSVFDVKDEWEWMEQRWRDAVEENMSWEEMRAGLKDIMWIDPLQDKLGRAAFQELNRCQQV